MTEFFFNPMATSHVVHYSSPAVVLSSSSGLLSPSVSFATNLKSLPIDNKLQGEPLVLDEDNDDKPLKTGDVIRISDCVVEEAVMSADGCARLKVVLMPDRISMEERAFSVGDAVVISAISDRVYNIKSFTGCKVEIEPYKSFGEEKGHSTTVFAWQLENATPGEIQAAEEMDEKALRLSTIDNVAEHADKDEIQAMIKTLAQRL
jgi:FKBP-type peptidyl-prolyl cis-trans isomerase 2